MRTLLLIAALAWPALAGDVLEPGTPELDRPTLISLGIKFPITGDDNYNASVSVRYRKAGEETWHEAMPLWRVHPEAVTGWTVAPNFSGTIFELRPATDYEIELHASDPDGPVDQFFTLTASTRSVPADPVLPNPIAVSDTESFKAALAAAQPGDVITLAEGQYDGPFGLYRGGTPDNPLVVRGASQEGVVIDAHGYSGNAFEAYGSFVHIENLTLRNATRGFRFQTAGSEGNVLRRVHIADTRLGIGCNPDQRDFYIADNILEGRLQWPAVYTDDHGSHANDDGIRVQGFGHVVAHNRITGYGDAMKVEQDGARAVDFYGNEVLSAYDNGIELDGSEGNARCFRNRFTNTYATLSAQPIYGGPAYFIRNVVVNVAHEQMKIHATVPETSGMLFLQNTFVSPGIPLKLETGDTAHHFVIENNLFVGPESLPEGRAVYWTAPIDDGTFDYNGYFPDGRFDLARWRFPDFAAFQSAGFESGGVLLAQPVFASGLVPPPSYAVAMDPQDVSLDPASNAIDRARPFPNVNDLFTGAAPDLGALEAGCPQPLYGPRPDGVDESNERFGCEATAEEAPPTTETAARRRSPAP